MLFLRALSLLLSIFLLLPPVTTRAAEFTPPQPLPVQALTVSKTQAARRPLYVLMFHSVLPDDAECSPWGITVSQFRQELQWLQDHGYTTVLPSQLASGEALPQRPVLLTFDDGYVDNYTLAYPVLCEFQAKAVISPIIKLMDEQNEDFLSWDMCRDMMSSGLVEIGSHTYDAHISTRCLTRLEGETQEDYQRRIFPDLLHSIALIEENLAVTPLFFAYPHGEADPWADEFLTQHFAVSVTTCYGTADLSKGLYQLPRYNINMVQHASAFLPK